MSKKLYKSATDKKIDGICAGIAEFFDIDPTLIRAAFVFAAILSGIFPGVLAYIVLALIIPRNETKEAKK